MSVIGAYREMRRCFRETAPEQRYMARYAAGDISLGGILGMAGGAVADYLSGTNMYTAIGASVGIGAGACFGLRHVFRNDRRTLCKS